MAITDTIKTVEGEVVGFLGTHTWAKALAAFVIAGVIGLSTYELGASNPVTVGISKVGYELLSSTVSDTTVITAGGSTTIVTKPGASVSLTEVSASVPTSQTAQ